MKKLIAVLTGLLLLMMGCSTTHSVNIELTKNLTTDLKTLSPSIENVQFTFRRPNLYCSIDMSKDPDIDELEAILTKMKEFSTVENINEIARSVNWGLEISNIYLDIHVNSDQKTIEYAYYARYFKTFDASDHSEANIEAYKIWYERTEP